MKKFWKIFAISLGSLLGLVLITVVVALWLVFTPARLTPIVAEQLPRFVTCEAGVERVELTFFSSFPHLGLKVDGVRLVNPTRGAPGDTLARLGRLNAAVDVKAFLKRDELILSDIVLRNGLINLYTDSLGRVNYDIMKSTPGADTVSTEGGFSLGRIDVDLVTLENIDVNYTDCTAPMKASIAGLSGTVKAGIDGEEMNADIAVAPLNLLFSMGSADSLMTATVALPGLDLAAAIKGDAVDAELSIPAGPVGFAYGGEHYLTDAEISITAGASADLAAQSADIRNCVVTLNGLELALDGAVRNDTIRGIDTDLHYKFVQWPLEKVLVLIPASFTHYMDGISAAGKISSEGTVKGLYGENSMPAVDANVIFEEGRISYPAMLPYPLNGVAANLDVHTDLTDAASYTQINSLRARTPKSSLSARGKVDRLFSDPHAAVSADVAVDMADATPFIPGSLKLTAAGKVSGRVNADVRMSQLTAMALDKMRLSGSLLVTGLDARYDTISVATPSAKLDFSLPNAKPSTRHTSFAGVSLAADRLTARTDDSTRLALDGAHLALEISNILDTLNMPAVVCDFAFANLTARMDDMSVEAAAPSGKLSMEPGRRNAAAQRMQVVYNGGRAAGKMAGMTAALEKLNIDASILYDDGRPDLWQQLSPRGTLAASGVTVDVPSLNYPVEVPELAMDITPRQFNIEKARVKLDESDFSLSGTVDNIQPYFSGDSILRAEFNFTSPVTNVTQLLALTSGLGDERLEAEKAAAEAAPDEFTGPYMVPKGIDITLHASIDEVLWEGESLLSHVKGDIQVRDGVLFITPDVSFDSPVTNGYIQVMYRTPAKNNLFAGVGIHLNRIDMHELVELVPDLDDLMPMLRGFSGEGEFHCAAEGYMDSTYRFKMSTLRGAGSIVATDLALKDDELFRKIAVLLKYKEDGTLRIDSMRAEFTVLRNDIKIYPFLLKVDRYGAVVSGNHNLDMSFDYNISLVESPLPFRVAVDVKGTPDDLKFKVFSKSRYPDFYRPKYEGLVESREMELRNLIRNSLLKGSKD